METRCTSQSPSLRLSLQGNEEWRELRGGNVADFFFRWKKRFGDAAISCRSAVAAANGACSLSGAGVDHSAHSLAVKFRSMPQPPTGLAIGTRAKRLQRDIYVVPNVAA